MKIGFYGGMANNMYVCAQILYETGVSVVFIRDRIDRYAMSQPVWEDCRAIMSCDEANDSPNWEWDRWTKWEEDNSWEKPNWIFDPMESQHDEYSATKIISSNKDHSYTAQDYINFYAAKDYINWIDNAEGIIEQMRSCDYTMVCGVLPTILAKWSGNPYVIVPHGGDICLAAGITKSLPTSPFEEQYGSRIDAVLRDAYDKANCFATGTTKLGGYVEGNGIDLRSKLPNTQFKRFGIPVRIRPRPEFNQRKQIFKNLQENELNLPSIDDDTFVIFVPSRIDYKWKGHDRLIQALNNIKNKKFHIFFSGWGEDTKDFQKKIGCKRITILPFIMSKPVLYDFYRCSDLVIDQFAMGHYGTVATEAMACGAPVMIWIDEDEYHSHEWEPPPVLNCQTSDEITVYFEKIFSEQIDLEKEGLRMQDWVSSLFGPEASKRQALNMLS